MDCQYCKKTFTTKTKLNQHQRKAKYCLNIQGAEPENTYVCKYCDKIFYHKTNYCTHIVTHEKKEDFMKYQHELEQLREKNRDYENVIILKDNTIEEKNKIIENKEAEISEYKAIIERITIKISESKDLKIQHLTKKYVKSQPRVQYQEINVVYIITTANMKNERRYILGKTSNLTSRLSTYNKSEEHEVIYYQDCLDKQKMNIVENMVFFKLNDYREVANRERFILPENKTIDLFIDTIKQCVEFVK